MVALKINESLNKGGFDVYPNPFKTEFTIQYNSLTDEKVTIILRAINGTVVDKRVVRVRAGNNNIPLRGSNELASGSYIVELKSATGKFIKQVVKK